MNDANIHGSESSFYRFLSEGLATKAQKRGKGGNNYFSNCHLKTFKFMEKSLQITNVLGKIMRFTVVQLILLGLFVGGAFAHESYSQDVLNQAVTVEAQAVEMKKVLQAIEKQTQAQFVFSSQTIKSADKVTINVTAEKLGTVLNKIFTPLSIAYEVKGAKILLRKIDTRSGLVKDPPEEAVNPVKVSVARPVLFVVSGTVMGDDKEPLVGANVVLEGTTKGVVTDENGVFRLELEDSEQNGVLIFSYVGFEKLTQPIERRTIINVVLKETNALNEVVVIGYGTSRKRDLTGAVASIPMADLEKMPVTSADQMIQGRISGVHVYQTNAEPGGNVSIRIRGTNSINSGNEPLFVVDGFPGAGDLNSINPSDIASIEILKDASATAIYGSRGANGVVLITTKKGTEGQHKVSFETFVGVQQIAKPYELMNAKEFAAYLNDVQNLANKEAPSATRPLPYTQSQIDSMGAGTDWQAALFQTAPTANYQLGFNGGNKDTRYNLSFNYFNQEGIVINSGLQRASVRFNFDRNLSDRLKLGFTSQFARTFEDRALVNTNGGTTGGVILDALRMSPIVPLTNSDGSYTYVNSPLPYVEQVGNPIAYAKEAKDQRGVLRGLANVFLEYELLKGLKLKVSGGADLTYSNRQFFRPSTLFLGSLTNGNALRLAGSRTSWVNENTLSYDKNFNPKNALNVVVGFSAQAFQGEDFTAASSNFFTNALGSDNLAFGGNVLTPTSNADKNTLASYFTRLNYRLNEKYLATFTVRADGSSRFGAGNKWGYFPSGALAWRISEEPFIKNIKAISEFKLRLSFGITGNQEIGSYSSIARYVENAYTLGGATRVVGVGINNVANPNLTWESTRSFDAGFDFAVFDGKIGLTVDYYDKKTNDLLLQVSIPRATGFQSVLLNAGSVSNKGLEIGLNTVNVDKGKLRWTSNFNISFNRNKVLDLNGEYERFVGQSSNSIFPGANAGTSVLRVGEPFGSFYGYQFLGLWQTQEEINAGYIKNKATYRPGDPKYADTNGDSVISALDRVIIGRAQPKFIWGFTNNINFGRFGLSVFLHGSQGISVLNLNRYELESGISSTNKLQSVTQRWTGENTSNTIPKANSAVRRNTGVTSDIVEDASFIRLKNISLSYDIFDGKKTSGRQFIKTLNVYFTAQNLFTWTKYTGYDPEVNSFGNANLSLNTDYNAYPRAKTYVVGVKCGF